MAFLLRHCARSLGRQSLKEINKVTHGMNGIKIVGNDAKNFAAIAQQRNMSTKDTEKSKDSLKKTEQVYYGVLTPQIRSVKIFSLLSSIGGLACQPILYEKTSQMGSTGAIIGVCSVVGFFTFVTPLLLHMVTKKYITHLDYNEEEKKYTAYAYTFLIRRKKIEFTPDDVKVPDVPGMFTTCLVKGSPVFMDPRLFEDPSHYRKIMGYDKPLDFKLNLDDAVETKNK